MTDYDISGITVHIPTSTENYINFMRQINPFITNFNSDFTKRYNREGNCTNIYNNALYIIDTFLSPPIQKCVNMLNDRGIYSIDEKIFKQQYLKDSFVPFMEAVDEMMYETEIIESNRQEAKEFRQQRKSSRSRWSGGGFGISGALKGAAKAGALNMASGALHSARNAVGNAGSAIAASAEKSAVFSKYREILREEMQNILSETIYKIIKCLEQNTNCSFAYLIDGNSPDSDIARSIINSYQAGKIPNAQAKEQLVLALKNNPAELEIYKLLWSKCGDENGDLRKMAAFFDVPLADHILSLASHHCESIFADHCKEYMTAANPLPIAIKIEADVITARDKIKEYCEKQKIPLKDIAVYEKCSTVLHEVEEELCTVNGIRHDTRQTAEAVRNDRTLFYEYLQNKNLDEENVYEGLCKLSFQSALYQDKLREIFEQEKTFRDPTKIFSNLKEISKKYFSEEKTPLGKIEFARTDQSLEQKEKNIRNITQMPEHEIPVMLINYASNGKSGILLTNLALRIYSKGLFSSENKMVIYHNFLDITCCGNNKYVVQTPNGRLEFTIKSGMDIAMQNHLCKLLQNAIFTIKNLKPEELNSLRFIDAASLRCDCGTLLPTNTTICPSCFKIYTKEKIFVNTMPCKSCGNRMPEGKNFCNKCGSKLTNETAECENNDTVNQMTPDTAATNGVILTKITAPCCPKCGNNIKEGKRFCSKCGTAL